MFPQIEGNAKKQPKANNEHVQEEIRKEEDQNLVQPGSNESVMSYMLNKMLNAANSDNMLDLDAYADQEEEIIPYNGKSDNIVNDNNIINNNIYRFPLLHCLLIPDGNRSGIRFLLPFLLPG